MANFFEHIIGVVLTVAWFVSGVWLLVSGIADEIVWWRLIIGATLLILLLATVSYNLKGTENGKESNGH